MKIAVIGTGYVGLVTGVSLALLGHNVVCIGREKFKIEKINKGTSPFYEPGLDNLLKKVLTQKLLQATNNFQKAVSNSNIIIIAVGTPTIGNRIDLSAIKTISKQIGKELRNSSKYQVVVVKSTVVPSTTEKIIKPLLEKYSNKKIGEFGLCMSPEFLREGNAVKDATNPDRIVIGQIDEKSGILFSQAYEDVFCPKVFTNLTTAEMTKYAANSLFATLISYSNEIARICESIKDIDVVDVWKGVHLDSRLSSNTLREGQVPGIVHYIFSGCGYGGSCFPKDTKALLAYAKSIGVETPIIKGVIDVNSAQPERMVDILKKTLGNLKNKKIGILGLTFKAQTDDLRGSASISVIKSLIGQGAKVFCHDPSFDLAGDKRELYGLKINICKTIDETLRSSDGALLMTAWEEYTKIMPSLFKKLMKTPVLVDGRRIYSARTFLKAGVIYRGIGYSG